MALGVVCHWLKERKKKNGKIEIYNSMSERSLQLGRLLSGAYSDEKISSTYKNNCENLLLMSKEISSFTKCFRVSSSLIPLADKVDRSLWDNEEIKSILRAAGDVFKTNGTRLTCHPGQFCVLSSEHARVIKNSIFDLEYHAWIMDSLGMPRSTYASINIHGGKSKAAEKLIDSICDLPEGVRSRLTLENDESCYSTKELLEVHSVTGIPVVFDSHHHTFNDDGMAMEEAQKESMQTWNRNIKPLQHVSNTDPSKVGGSFTDRRKHADYIHKIPDCQLEQLIDGKIDLECEAKAKNFAVASLRKELLEKFPSAKSLL